jgi:hypothetical protein
MLSGTGEALDVQGLLNDAARIEYFFARRLESSDYTPAPELLTITDSTLTQTDAGAIITGTASNTVALLEWTIHAALYDESGKLLDLVSTVGHQWVAGEELRFELPPANPEATRFELYSDVTIWQQSGTN